MLLCLPSLSKDLLLCRFQQFQCPGICQLMMEPEYISWALGKQCSKAITFYLMATTWSFRWPLLPLELCPTRYVKGESALSSYPAPLAVLSPSCRPGESIFRPGPELMSSWCSAGLRWCVQSCLGLQSCHWAAWHKELGWHSEWKSPQAEF